MKSVLMEESCRKAHVISESWMSRIADSLMLLKHIHTVETTIVESKLFSFTGLP